MKKFSHTIIVMNYKGGIFLSRSKVIILSFIGIVYLSVFFSILIHPRELEKIKEPNIEEQPKIVSIGSKHFNTLQQAIDASTFQDRILLHQDITENIVIEEKNITIDGNGHTIYGAQFEDTSEYKMKAIIELENSSLILEHITIDGLNGIDENKANIGIYNNHSTLRVENTKIQNINHQKNKWLNYPYGTAIYVVNDNENEVRIEIINSVIESFHQTGIYINNRSRTSLFLSVANVTIEGLGKTKDVCQRGIVLFGNIEGTLEKIKLRNLQYIGFGEKASGLIFQNKMDELIVSGNTFENVDVENKVEEDI